MQCVCDMLLRHMLFVLIRSVCVNTVSLKMAVIVSRSVREVIIDNEQSAVGSQYIVIWCDMVWYGICDV